MGPHHLGSIVALALLLHPLSTTCQNTTSSKTLSFGGNATLPTKTFNPALASTYLPNNDYSNEQLRLLWDQVGPISTGFISTTVSPTVEPTAFAQPGIYHPLVRAYEPSLADAQLPENFAWGVAGAAFQVEGAAKDEGKGPTIWDLLPHREPGAVADNTTGDVAPNHYYLYKQDFARLAALGIPYNSQSISWARIFPFGHGALNAEGVAHYDDVIQEQVQRGITPVVTLFHWDTPLALFNEYGAWTSPKIVDDYFEYAKFVIERYDEYVPIWYTINEPQYCDFQYQSFPAGLYYPTYNNITRGQAAKWTCGHYTALANAKVGKWYHEVFKGKGKITYKSAVNFYTPASNSSADIAAAERMNDFSIGWFAGPWTDGDYPASLKSTLGSLLPNFTEEEKAMIKGSNDFYAIDPYTTYTISAPPNGIDACAANSSDPLWPVCIVESNADASGFPLGPAADPGSTWLWSTPTGIRRLLGALKARFPTVPEFVISEFGFVEPGEGERTDLNSVLWDLRRADYFQGYLDNILAARVEDGVNVTGAFAWAIFDNIEWFSGQMVRFGLQHVNYTDPNLTRTPKASMFQFTNWFKQHGGARILA